MRILISNDDGVHSPGLIALAESLKSYGDITVMAPDRDRSAASNSLTLTHPLRVQCLSNGFYAVEGTPTDCVHLAATGYFDEPFDLIVTGVNAGANLGDDVLYSGTVAAAMEGKFLGIPAVAFSMLNKRFLHLETAQWMARKIVGAFIEKRIPQDYIINVNIPDQPKEKIKGIEVTRLGSRHKSEPTLETQDPRGQSVYWIGPAGPGQDTGIGTDFHAVANGYISMTPLQLDLTHYEKMDTLSKFVMSTEWV